MFKHHNIIKGTPTDQQFILPVNVLEWLHEKDVVYLLLSILEVFNIESFLSKHRADGVGSAFYNPRSMLGILMYAMIRGEKSSRRIEVACHYDVGYHLAGQGLTPDYTTIARFRVQNADEITQLFKDFAKLLVKSQVTRIGVLAIDGTKMEGQASLSANRKAKYIETELNRLFKESMECDRQETLDGTTPISGDYLLPDERASIEKKKVVLQKSLDKLNERQEIEAEKQQARIRDRENEEAETGKKKRGRKLAKPTTAPSPDAKVNPTDPTSQIMSTTHGFIQGFNGQIVVTEDQFIIAAALTDDQNDKNQFQPMMEEVNQLLESVPKEEQPQVILADSGYCSTQNVLFETPDGPKFYFATSKERKMQESGVDEAFLTRLDELCRTVPGMCAATIAELASIGTGVWNTFLNRERPATQQEVCWAIMGARVRSPTGRELYRKRKIMPEPVFGNIKFNMRLDGFRSKGRINVRVSSVWLRYAIILSK